MSSPLPAPSQSTARPQVTPPQPVVRAVSARWNSGSRRMGIRLVPAVAVLLLCAGPAFSQTNSLFGSAGPLSQGGGRTTGNTGRATGGFGQTGGAAGLGSTGATTGLNTAAGTGGLNNFGALSGTIGQGFVGRADNLGRFVGNNQAVQGATGNTGGSGLQGFNRGGGQRNQQNFGGNNQFNQNSGQGSRPVFRPRVEIAFSYPRASPADVRQAASTRFSLISRRYPQLAGVQLTGGPEGTIVLTGTVADERSRRMAEHLLRLEPGVRKIDNQLAVGDSPDAGTPGFLPPSP
ncbi:MAG: BON domain-containing protein [Planctomycetaceae bacterium]|nr:BON domain-containing protein [Planctomycetaceae bacterium]